MSIASKFLPAIALAAALSPLAANATIHPTGANSISGAQHYSHVVYGLSGDNSRGGDGGGGQGAGR